MTTTGLDTFDTTVHETNAWLKDIMERLKSDNRRLAYSALRCTLHALRDRLTPESAVHLGAQLPMLVRGFYYEGWRPSDTPTNEKHADNFIDRVDEALPAGLDIDPEAAVIAVLAVMADRLDAGEIAKVARQLPRDMHQLWPEAFRGA